MTIGGHALRTECPHCGERGQNHVVRTDPKPYRWSDAAIDLCKRLAGRDIDYRIRVRRCESCGREYETAELDATWIAVLTEEVLRLEDECEGLRSRGERLRAAAKEAAQVLRSAAERSRD